VINNTYTKNFLLNDQSLVKRSHVINYLINKYSYQKYLEIGIFDGFTFKDVDCELKHGVDPGAEGVVSPMVTHRMTSDDFFSQTTEKYDLIFIDGLHYHQQVIKDINNALKHINTGGHILLHDCNPCDELSQRIPRETIAWNGDVWKAFVLFRKQNPNAECFVLNTDFGIGVIKYDDNTQPISYLDIDISYENFEKNKIELLNLRQCNNQEQLESIYE
jgi:hypothetical protein